MKKSIFSLLMLFTLTSCSFGLRDYGPYHHEVEIHKPVKYVEYNNEVYCQVDLDVYKLVDNSFVAFNFESEEEIVFDFDVYEDKFYVATVDGLKVYDSNLNYEKTLVDNEVHTFLIHKDILYYNLLDTIEKLLYGYDLNTDTKTFLIEELINDVYSDCERPIYANQQGCIFFLDELPYANIAKGVARNDTFGFLQDSKVGTVKLEDEKIVLEYNESTYEYDGYKVAYYNPDIYLNNDKLVFSIYKYAKHDNCNYYKCMCRYEQAKVIEFDFKTLTFTTKFELPEGAFLLSLANEEIVYYHEGKIIANEETLKGIDKFEPKGEYMQKNSSVSLKGKTKWLDVFMSYYNKELYIRMDDHSDSIKDEY